VPLPPKFNPCIHTALVRVVKLGVVKGGCDNFSSGSIFIPALIMKSRPVTFG
jgi:hypothetical protein